MICQGARIVGFCVRRHSAGVCMRGLGQLRCPLYPLFSFLYPLFSFLFFFCRRAVATWLACIVVSLVFRVDLLEINLALGVCVVGHV